MLYLFEDTEYHAMAYDPNNYSAINVTVAAASTIVRYSYIKNIVVLSDYVSCGRTGHIFRFEHIQQPLEPSMLILANAPKPNL